MSANLKTFIWHYKKTSKNTLFLDVFLLIFSAVVFLQDLNIIYLFIIYLIVYSLNSNNLLELSNSVLAGTPIKIKSVINFNSFVIWAKATVLISSGLIASLFIKSIDMQSVINIFGYVVFAYSFFNFIFALKYFISKPYRNFIFYVLSGGSILMFFLSSALNFWFMLALILILTIIILLASKVLSEKLSFEKILRNEEKQ